MGVGVRETPVSWYGRDEEGELGDVVGLVGEYISRLVVGDELGPGQLVLVEVLGEVVSL